MSEPRTIAARPLTAESFAPYGEVVSVQQGEGKSANQGTARRFDHVAALESDRQWAQPNLAVFESQPQVLPFEVKLLEHHPHSSQTFLPLRAARLLVVVAPAAADGGPDVSRLEAFLAAPGQGFSYRKGMWHHPIVALDAPAELAMLAWEDGEPGDCVERAVSPISVSG